MYCTGLINFGFKKLTNTFKNSQAKPNTISLISSSNILKDLGLVFLARQAPSTSFFLPY